MAASTREFATARQPGSRRAGRPRPRRPLPGLDDPRLLLGGILVGLFVLAALAAPALAPHDPLQMHARQALADPSSAFPLGTDQYGRDVLSRMLVGSRVSLELALAASAVATLAGGLLGLLAGYYGGWVDLLAMRAMDLILAFPATIVAIAVVALLGGSLANLVVVIGVLYTPAFARLTYASVQSVKHNPYVEAARSIGAGDLRIMRSAILPNSLGPLLVQASFSLGAAILLESGLSFLGLGTQPPMPSWGVMVAEARGFMDVQPLMVVWPSLAVALCVLAFNVLGDGLRDALDPRLRNR